MRSYLHMSVFVCGRLDSGEVVGGARDNVASIIENASARGLLSLSLSLHVLCLAWLCISISELASLLAVSGNERERERNGEGNESIGLNADDEPLPVLSRLAD